MNPRLLETLEKTRKRNKAIMQEYVSSGLSYRAIAAKYGISYERVRQIVHREMHKDLSGQSSYEDKSRIQKHRKAVKVLSEEFHTTPNTITALLRRYIQLV